MHPFPELFTSFFKTYFGQQCPDPVCPLQKWIDKMARKVLIFSGISFLIIFISQIILERMDRYYFDKFYSQKDVQMFLDGRKIYLWKDILGKLDSPQGQKIVKVAEGQMNVMLYKPGLPIYLFRRSFDVSVRQDGFATGLKVSNPVESYSNLIDTLSAGVGL